MIAASGKKWDGTGLAGWSIGDVVLIRSTQCTTHYRTPNYIKGKRGVIVRSCGRHGDPEQIAYGVRPAQMRNLYRVRFAQSAVWDGYRGSALDTIDVEVYDHWLLKDEEGRDDGRA